LRTLVTAVIETVAGLILATLTIARLVFAAFTVTGTELTALAALVGTAKTTVLRTVTKVTALRALVTTVVETVAWSAIAGRTIAGLVFTAFTVTGTELTALATLVRTAKATILRTVAKITALRALVTTVVETVAGRAIAWPATAGLILAALAVALTFATVFAIGLETAITTAEAAFAALGRTIIPVRAGPALIALREAATAFAIIAARTPIGTAKARGTGSLVTFTLRAIATRATIRTVAAGRSWAARSGLFCLGRLGRCTQNRARRRGIGRRGGIASTWGAGLFWRFD
jgi:hypothetical protein